MKGIRWFQRFMITLLIAVNAFVFMSMRGFALEDNILYTAGLITSSIIILTLLSYLLKHRKKKSIED
jgi:hypothetical protein